MSVQMIVKVSIATLWRRPDSARRGDEKALAVRPDISAWIAELTTDQKLDSPVVTQLLRGERVLVEQIRADGWARVVALDQPAAALDPRGYPGWLRASHLAADQQVSARPRRRARPERPTGPQLVAAARQFLGVPYVWGGLSKHGLDCSGLVHLIWRQFGVSLPRDAAEQTVATDAVPGTPEPGDLYFFARNRQSVNHVGLVVTPDVMIHASSTARHVVEERLSGPTRSLLVAVRRGPVVVRKSSQT